MRLVGNASSTVDWRPSVALKHLLVLEEMIRFARLHQRRVSICYATVRIYVYTARR
jgi:hypothetical protein